MANQALFLVTVWFLFWFLRGGAPARSGASLAIDAALALQFCVIHSWLLHPAARKHLERYIPSAFYGTFFSTVTCLSLLITIAAWQTSPQVLLSTRGWAAGLILGAFGLSWLALFESLRLTGFGYQTGWTPFLAWLRRRAPERRKFQPRGAYRWLRHPVYFSFLGLLWFTPVVTADRLLLIAFWTVYIAIGSHLKDQRLVHYIGDVYRDYQARVPGYPGIAFGPLARVPWSAAPLGSQLVD